MAEEKKRFPTAVIVGLGAAGAAAMGLGLWLLTRRPAEPEPPEPGRANIWGKVTDVTTGQGIPGATVTVASIVVYTDSNGTYLHEDIVPGSYTISFDAGGYESASIETVIVEGNNEVSIGLIPVGEKAEYHCGVWDSITSEPIVNALVVLDGPVLLEQRVNNFGDVSFYDLPAGTYQITISKTSYQTLQETVTIPPGRTEQEFYLVYQEPSQMEGIDVRWVVVEPAAVFQGEEFMVRAQCVNEKGYEGDFDIVCNIDGLTFIETVHFSSPGWKEVIFRLSLDDAGSYNVCVGDKCQLLQVAEVEVGLFCCPYCGATSTGMRCVESGWERDPVTWWPRKVCYKEEDTPFTTLALLTEHIRQHVVILGVTVSQPYCDYEDPLCLVKHPIKHYWYEDPVNPNRSRWITERPYECRVQITRITGTSSAKIAAYQIVGRLPLASLECETAGNYGFPLNQYDWYQYYKR